MHTMTTASSQQAVADYARFAIGFDPRDRDRIHALIDEVIDSGHWSEGEMTRRFEAAWDEIKGLGFDERFRRLWRFYLGYCEAGFRTERTNVVQLSLTKS